MVDRKIVAERLKAQGIAGAPLPNTVAVAERLLAVQGQDPRGARLAVRSRTRGLTAADVDGALNERALLITWLNRGTLHLVRSEDYPWLHALTAPRLFTANARRLAEEGVSPRVAERGVKTIRSSLAEEGPLTRAQLRARLEAARVRTEGQALVHLLTLATLEGHAVRGPMAGKQHAYALVDDWLGPVEPVARETALAELARRYLAGHAPADDRDLARWAGLPLGEVRAGLEAIAPELEQRPDGLLQLKGQALASRARPIRLLGAYDPLLLGWASREPIVGSHSGLVTSNGLFRPFALVDGRAAAIWKLVDGEVELEPLTRFSAKASAALRVEAADVERFLGG